MKKKIKNAFEHRAKKKAKSELTERELKVIKFIGPHQRDLLGYPIFSCAESISRFLGDREMSSYIKSHRTKGEGDEKDRYRCSATGKRVVKSLIKKGLIQMNMWRIHLTEKGRKYVPIVEQVPQV